ncbi:hypothetical protein APR12_003483 [Nocardia amikacinitolerans]|uniref:hypothetical protein n=1 Tax=Nocardia amikacinitolerans TaxID=756689 RepID=UPI00083439EF|nr:hypothetical protein [Nocardia amikacinitolerans]MCP2318130.1 hypothetical protein [Nocardia amikacinitolerans]
MWSAEDAVRAPGKRPRREPVGVRTHTDGIPTLVATDGRQIPHSLLVLDPQGNIIATYTVSGIKEAGAPATPLTRGLVDGSLNNLHIADAANVLGVMSGSKLG